MLKVGITGGIGSGKSLVAQLFTLLNVPVYYADDAAKQIMNTDEDVRKLLIKHFGDDTYIGSNLNRQWLATKVFNNPEQLQLLNSIVHPVVIKHANQWIQQQQTAIVIKEAAIFFESGSYKEMDVMIGVYAPKELRLERVARRDASNRVAIEERMSRQMNEEEKMKRCDFVISNNEESLLIPQVIELHNKLLQLAATH
jgi:dephospho-CoA kinase